MKAQPGPIVSGSHFFPKAPLLWVKWMPAWAVMSRKVMVCACAKMLAAISSKSNTHHGGTEAQRNAGKESLPDECITFGLRKLWRREQLPGFARLDGRGRPSLREP